jgi:hypothetical protein
MALIISALVLTCAGMAGWVAWEVIRGRRWDQELSRELAAFLDDTEASEDTIWLPAISISDALSLELRQRSDQAQRQV